MARAKGRLKGRQPKLTAKQQKELRRMHATGDYTITDLDIDHPRLSIPRPPPHPMCPTTILAGWGQAVCHRSVCIDSR